MPEAELLERIASDLDFLKKKVVEIEENVEDINIDLLYYNKHEFYHLNDSISRIF